ncbi:hypothetical protein LVQ77_17180 [Buttiauxella sp. S04-F03]|uniref:RecE family exodeoxyribonuclease n=1 Tax=Buttiauxella sp. W03-F01 TaxID=2904524 RepID=UPI001E2D7794|nr:RecE family exodeoxyribonuclease [Buttiauxella sp. W03-F01]MCE0802019.1 hypothetical protein [Buttiauxella sp. W03-F01]
MFTWFDCKSESRADREIMNILEDNDIETGRGADYMLPVRTNVPVFDDLPEERVLDASWGERYELADDSKTWQKIVAVVDATPESPVIADAPAPTTEIIATAETSSAPTATADITTADKDLVVDANDDDLTEYPVAEMAFGRRLLSQLISTVTAHHIKHAQRVHIMEMSLDTDNSYVQNLLLAARNAPGLEDLSTAQLWKYTYAIKTVFPMDKRHELTRVVQFSNLWLTTEHIDRGILVREWAAGNYITSVQRTPSGANAGGVIHSDRLTPQTALGLEYEIAQGILARNNEFDIYNPPMEIDIMTNSIMNKYENQEFLATREIFISMPGGFDFSRACNVATVKTTPPGLWKTPVQHLEYLNRVMTETDHAHPDPLIVDIACGRSSLPMPMTVETNQTSVEEVNKQLAAARGEFVEGISDPSDPKWVHEDLAKATSNEVEKEEIQPAENTSDEQMETTDGNEISGGVAVSASEGTDANDPQAAAVEEPELTEAEEESSAQQIQNLTQRIERLESALAAMCSVFSAEEVA